MIAHVRFEGEREGLKSCSAAVSYRIVCAIVGGSTGEGRQRPTSIQNGLCRSLISQNFLPKGDTNRRFRRTLRNKRFFRASDTTANQRARSSCLRPPHPNARLGILGHARAHRFRARPALPSAPRPPARPPPRARVAGRVSRRLHRDGHARAWLHRRTDGRSRARWTPTATAERVVAGRRRTHDRGRADADHGGKAAGAGVMMRRWTK